MQHNYIAWLPRKTFNAEFQTDMVFYIGTNLKIPAKNKAPVNLNEFDLPTWQL